MKTFTIIILALLYHQLALAQTKTEVYYGIPDRTEWITDIIELYDRGYYISGGYIGNEFNKGWNLKTDINLGMIYNKTFTHDLGDVAPAASTSDQTGNIYVTGYTIYPDQWPFVTKLDSCGNKIWCRIITNSNFSHGTANDILITDENEIIVQIHYNSTLAYDRIHLAGLSEEGDVLWIHPYASRYDYPWLHNASSYSMKEINNSYYLSGYCYYPYPNDTNHVYLRPLFIGIDSLFQEKWIIPFAALDSVFGKAYKTIPLNDSVFMGAGIRRFYGDEDHSLLMFYNEDGEELGYSEITNSQIGPNINSNEIRDIERINDTLFITGSFFGPGYNSNPVGELVFDTAGTLYNFKSHPTAEYIPCLLKTYDGKFVVTTTVVENKYDWDIYIYKIDENLNDVPFDPTPHTYDSLCPGVIQSDTTNLTNCFVWTDVGDAPSPGEYYASIQQIPITAYPNPAKDRITFGFENTKHHSNIQLQCFNLLGKQVHEEKIFTGQEETLVNLTGWPEGMYVAVVVSDGKVVGKVKFVVL